ncbi:glycosyltransferase [bacterium]|nr:glycosyltransferase [bacterium]
MRLAVVGNSRLEHVLRWVRHFVARGHEVHVISVWATEIEGVQHHQIGAGSRGLLRRLGSYVKLARELGDLLDEIQPDIVHAHFAYTYGAAVARTGFHPVMLVTQGSDVLLPRWWELAMRPLTRFALRHADVVACNSVGQVVATHRHGASCPIHQLAYGVDLEEFSRREVARPPGQFRLGIFKALRPLYGHCDLLDAFALVAKGHPHARLVIAGDGPLRGRLEEQARTLGIADRVEFPGRLERDEVINVMSGLDAVALTSYSEGLPNMVMEAFAMGIPAVATGVGGGPELVKHGKTGFLVPASDPWTLGAAISQLVDDPDGCRRMGQAAQDLVRAEHDCRRNLDEMEQVCLAMVQGGGPAFRFRSIRRTTPPR